MGLSEQLKQYILTDAETLKRSPFAELERAAELLLAARAGGKWIFAAGNGGSAATASHFANDFVKGLSVEGKPRFKAMALNDGVPIVTALANDYDYSLCYEEQLKNYGSAGDVLVVYSGSGNSPNVVKAAGFAKSIGMHVIGFTGRDGGRLAAFCTVNCIAP
jgi:D-sedoheptulose 7-phosphate isomerase